MFWEFVRTANAALSNTGSRWAPVFHALWQVKTEAHPDDPEAQRILRADGGALLGVGPRLQLQ